MPEQTANYQLPLPLEDEYYCFAVGNQVPGGLHALLTGREDEPAALRTEAEAAQEELSAQLASGLEGLQEELLAMQEQLEETIGSELTPLTGRVTEAEAKIATLWDAVFTNITGNPFTVVLSSLDGLTVTAGVWNAAQSRLEC